MSLHTYTNRQLRKLGGASLYMLVLFFAAYLLHALAPKSIFISMAIAIAAHLIGAMVYRHVANDD